MAEMPCAGRKSSGRNSQGYRAGVPSSTARKGITDPKGGPWIEAVVERENMLRALRQVEGNKGAAGVDQMPVSALRHYLRGHWPRIKADILSGRYRPEPVRRVEIPKPGGKGKRALGIPTVVDRLIQQALHQVLSRIFDPGFSEHSYGFRPGRAAHQAVQAARAYVAQGRRWVVDMDLEKFFDRVNHDILMARVARKVKDKRILVLIRRYLQSGVMVGGLVQARREGTPQGGPLSPLLSNILLDDLDKELERRGHAFCRYADDSNIYVRTKAAGERVMASITRFRWCRLKLRVNRDKSAVDRPWKRKFLGYGMTWHKRPRLTVAPESVKRLRGKLRQQFRLGRGRNLRRFIQEGLNPHLRGWITYFRLAEVKGIFEDLDGWIRRRLRCIRWRQAKRVWRRVKMLMRRGLSEERACRSATNGRGPWWNAGASHMNAAFPKSHFDQLGLVSLLDQRHRLQRIS